ncbi:hypothetical protein AK812_SmicGene29155 [Symbiodinium microadriaticum]|uniref:Uncharacterized protein n=1 Tax=Symbiodinium microadriaticum TaxID=2951 RepID=A0A1Q9D2K8_SYMMI|nr:hypothetical protein AK812_SmicGene29155 [Symbiodinium microadriaticum]
MEDELQQDSGWAADDVVSDCRRRLRRPSPQGWQQIPRSNNIHLDLCIPGLVLGLDAFPGTLFKRFRESFTSFRPGGYSMVEGRCGVQ